MGANQDFIIEPFRQRKHEFRADKGKKHLYPNQRKRWNLISHGQINLNLSLNQTIKPYKVMDTSKSFKHSAEIREYWRLVKRKQRARPRGVKYVKTDRTRILEVSKRNV